MASFVATSPLAFTLKKGKQSLPLDTDVGLFRPVAGTAITLRVTNHPRLYATGTIVEWKEKELLVNIEQVSGKGQYVGWQIEIEL